MSIFKKWSQRNMPQEAVKGGPYDPLSVVSDLSNPELLMVVPITNGFLVVNRKYNPNGPDTLTAMYAANPNALAEALANRLAQARLKI